MSAAAPSMADRILAGDVRALARGISLVESGGVDGLRLCRDLFRHTGRAYLIGLTGPPGAGKSTLVDGLTHQFRRAGRTVGIIAVDPTSPYSGGALLGDRVRMQGHAGDPGVFIRSMATRGQLGGLARSTLEVALLLDAAGREVVLIETVGVGQDEVDIVRAADVSVVALVPGLGDDVQALKAGLMEIGDIFVVNKADREGADRAVAELQQALAMRDPGPDGWTPPVLETVATTGEGIVQLVDALERFRERGAGVPDRHRDRAGLVVRQLLVERFWRVAEQALSDREREAMIGKVAAREIDPQAAVDQMWDRFVAAAREAPTRD